VGCVYMGKSGCGGKEREFSCKMSVIEKGLLGFAALRGRGTGSCRTPRTPSKPLGELKRSTVAGV
jgi:hypothetical protein